MRRLGVIGFGMFAACAHATHSPSGAPAAAVTAATGTVWRYEVQFVNGRDLVIQADFAGTHGAEFGLDYEATPFVHELSIAQGAAWRSVENSARAREGWQLACDAGCRLRYRFALGEAAAALHDIDTAIAAGDVLIAPPSSWLLHPDAPNADAEFELSVDAGQGSRFVSALRSRTRANREVYYANANRLDDAGFAAFGPLVTGTLAAGSAQVKVGIAPHELELDRNAAFSWIEGAAGAVANYYQGRPPAEQTLILLMHGGGHSTRGETLGGGGPAILVRASDDVTASNTRDDWVITHELLHANFPDLGREHAWLSEGLATYVEPLARARVGLLEPAKMWKDLVEGLPQGQPEPGDRGLERTHTWGRTYWGGALFCLVADVAIRERTGNRRSLDDALRAIAATGATVENHWPLERVLEEGDRATGTRVLHELYERLALAPGTVDLAELFARLGVKAQKASIAFDDQAPLSEIRRSLTFRTPTAPGSSRE